MWAGQCSELAGARFVVGFLINIYTVFQLHLRQQVKETPFVLGKNMRRLLSEKLRP